jgi:hypothetical protein
LRCLSFTPAPHVVEHAPHAPHGLWWQSTGHGLLLLQGALSVSDGQAFPPNSAAWRFRRMRTRSAAAPHVPLQSLQALQFDSWQSFGQGSSSVQISDLVSFVTTCVAFPHFLPPCLGGIATSTHVFNAPPQLDEHAPQCVSQPQWTGQ